MAGIDLRSSTSGSGASSGASLTPTAIKTAAYTATVGDFVPVDTTSGNVTVTLPAAPADKSQVEVKHIVRGGTNVVTVACAGSDVFNKSGGATTLTLTLLNQSAVLQYAASTGIWYVTTGDLSLAQLDARYATVTVAALTAQPWQASQTYSTGQVVSQGGALYTSPNNFTAGTTFNAANWSLGVTSGAQVYEQNGSGQVVAIWSGNGLGSAATKILSVLTAGAFTPQGAYNAGTTYAQNAIVASGGASYIAVAASTGVDPATDWAGGGSHWMQLAAQGSQGIQGPAGSPTTDQAILLRHLSDLTRDPTLITGHIAQTMDRKAPTSNVTITSGTLQFTAIAVPGGRTISNISLYTGSIGATSPTHQWFCLYDASRNKLAVTADDTTTAWAATTLKTLALTAPYTPSAGALLYVGVLITATTVPNLSGMGQSNMIGQAPALAGASTASLTDPASAPATAASFTSNKPPFWASLS